MHYSRLLSIRVLIIVILFCFGIKGIAQIYETSITKVTNQEGKSPSATFAISEDKNGFIWFGTVDGLYRYDGHNFKIFRNEPGNINSLSNNTIRDIVFDSEGNLWIATQGGGLNKFYPETKHFERFQFTGTKKNEIRGNSIWSVFIDKEDNVYLGITGKGVDKILKSSGEIESYNIAAEGFPIGPQDGIRALYVDSNNYIWANYGDKGITRLNPTTKEVKHFLQGKQSNNEISGNLVFDINGDRNQNIWVASYGGGLSKINQKSGIITQYSSSGINKNTVVSDLIYNIVENTNGDLWIATENGVSQFNPQLNVFKNFKSDVCDNNSISDNRVRCIYIDKNDIIWLGTESGVDRLISLRKFKLYKNIAGNVNSLSEGIVRGIYKDKDFNIWIGLIQNGLYKYNSKTKEYTSYYSDESNPNGLIGNHINLIFEDSQGTMWIGEWDHGLFRYNKKTERFENFASINHDKLKLSDNRIQSLIEGEPGILWIGTENGINRIDVEKKEIFYYFNETDNPNSLSGNSIQSNAFKFDSNGNLWVGTWENGLNKIEFQNGDYRFPKVTRWKNEPNKKNTLNNNNVISLHIDNSGIIWIGTFGGGLNKFNPSTNTFKYFTTEDGLPNNIIFSILEDHLGYLWMSTDNGLSNFDPTLETFINYDESDGLQSNHFFWGSSHKSFDGELFFGGINGLNSFYPEDITTDKNYPKGVLVNLLINNEPVNLDYSLTEISEIKLEHYENFITFEFTALDYTEPHKNLYKYKLEGVDNKWNEKGNSRIANYTSLKPGKYTFKYKVSNSDGKFNLDENSVKVTIRPPWYGSWVARIGFTLFFIGSLIAFYIVRVGVLQSQKKKLEILVQNRTKEIAAQNLTLENQKEQLSNRNHELNTTLEELSNTQKALIESEKMASLGILTAGVAHEINNPLNFISVSIDNIKAEIEEIQKMECQIGSQRITDLNELISHSETGIHRISSIIGSLQAFIRNNNEPLEETSPKELVESAVKMLKSKITDNIKVNFDFHSTPDIKCKKHQLAQVMINIIDNAIYAISEKKIQLREEEISISVRPFSLYGDKGVMFSISNTGPQIPNEVLKNLFDPFFTTKGPNKGTGLGLYLTYNIVNEHNGSLDVKNIDNKVVFDIFIPHL